MKAGFAALDITPQTPLRMAGFDRREGYSQGTLDRLAVSVLALCGEDQKPFLLCSFDLLGTDHALCEKVREMVSLQINIDKERIWVGATHTHSGPSGIFAGKEGYDEAYTNYIAGQALAAAVQAVAGWEESRCCTALIGVEGVAARRDMGRADSASTMAVRLVRFARNYGDILFYRFVCHPTVLDEKNRLFSRDLPGACAAAVGNGLQILFLNGACGDLSTRYTRTSSGPEELSRLGVRMGTAVSQADWSLAAPLESVITAECAVELKGYTAFDDVRRKNLIAALKQSMAACADPAERREYDARIAVLERKSYGAPGGGTVCVACADVGPVVLVALPFEIASADGANYESALSRAAGKPVCLVCYTNGYAGYLPSGRLLDENSSYEDLASRYGPVVRPKLLESAMQCVLKVTDKLI